MVDAMITVDTDRSSQDSTGSQENTPLLQGAKETAVRCRLKPRIAHLKAKTLEHYARIASVVMISVVTVVMDFTFRHSKLYSHWGFQKDDDRQSVPLPVTVHNLLALYIYLHPPVRLGFLAGFMLQTFTEVVTVFFTGWLSSTVTRSRYEAATDVHYYLLNCPNHYNVSSLAGMRFTPSDCLPPIEISPSTIEPPSNLVDGNIVITLALLALYSMSLAILLRPGLKFALTPLSLLLSFHFLFLLYQDSGFPCFYMLALVIYSGVLLGINAWVAHKVTEGEVKPPLIDRAQTQLQGGKTGETHPDGKRASIKMPMVPAYRNGALTHSGP